MYTYQDLQKRATGDRETMDFVRQIINDFMSSDVFQTAMLADEYDRRQNRTIRNYQKLLYTVSGRAVPDNWSANYKIGSNFFDRFIVQENQTLLANGVTFKTESTKAKLGEDFDTKLSMVGKFALEAGLCFAFFNLDHLEVFPVYSKEIPCFAPLYDEETGALRAGVRFWQLDGSKPLRATLFEEDGYTDYIWRKSRKGEVLKEKRPYIVKTVGDDADAAAGTLEYIGENYPTFPIVPLWGNFHHQSELIGLQEGIDCYDLIKSGFANTVDEASLIYWTINNAGGMQDIDLVQFVEHMRTIKAAVVSDDGASAESHSIEAPYASREALLERLEKDLYRDAMAVNTDDIAAGNVTATQIRAAYDAHNSKVDQYETCVIDFIQGILAVAGIEDVPTFTRSQVANETEMITNVLASAQYLSEEYITRKLLNLFGDGDLADEMIAKMDADELDRGRQLQQEAMEGDEDEAGNNPDGDTGGGDE